MSSMYPSFGGAPSRPCMRCGLSLAMNETQCSRCGTYNPLPQGQQFGMFQQGGAQGGTPGQGVAGGSAWGQPQQAAPNQPQAPNNGMWPGNKGASAPAWGAGGQGGGWQQNNTNNMFGGAGQSAQPSQPLQQNLFGAGFAGPNTSSFSNGVQNPNQSALNGSFPGAGFGQNAERPSINSFFQATQQNNGYSGGASPLAPNRPAWMKKPGDDDDDDGDKKGKNRPGPGVMIVIIILVVALLGGGGFGGYYLWHHRNGNTAGTPTVQPIVTPGTTPLFGDTFQNNTNGWSTTAPTGAKVTLGGGKLILESDNNTLFP